MPPGKTTVQEALFTSPRSGVSPYLLFSTVRVRDDSPMRTLCGDGRHRPNRDTPCAFDVVVDNDTTTHDLAIGQRVNASPPVGVHRVTLITPASKTPFIEPTFRFLQCAGSQSPLTLTTSHLDASRVQTVPAQRF